MITCKFESGKDALLRHVVVDVLVIKKNKILLVKRTKKLLEGGKWALVGGYLERDETVREAAEREIFEETGWRVKDVTLLRVKDSPDRPKETGRQNVAFVFFCTADRKEGEMDWESDEMKWFDLDALPSQKEMAFDHMDDIAFYKEALKQEEPLPIL